MAGSLTTFIEDVASPFLSQLTPCTAPEGCTATPGSLATASLWAPQSVAALALQALGVPPDVAIGSVRSI